jgi:hypothetical protein
VNSLPAQLGEGPRDHGWLWGKHWEVEEATEISISVDSEKGLRSSDKRTQRKSGRLRTHQGALRGQERGGDDMRLSGAATESCEGSAAA